MTRPVFGEPLPIEVVMEVSEDGNYTFYALGRPVHITVLDYAPGELNEDDEKEPDEGCEVAEVVRDMTLEQLVQKIRKENA